MQTEKISDEAKKQKLRLIYEKYKNRMYISACRILNDPFAAEDAVHDAFIALSRNAEKIGDVDSVSTASYVIKAAKNTAINMSVKKSREIIVHSIMSLDEKYRDVLSLYYLNELTVKELSDILGRKEVTVRQQLARGRKKLINIISKEMEDYDNKSVNQKSV